tara:strand:- start:270 stop:704 length:435 start_codon:yes stop_codon:yes gene_type:complete
MMSERELIQQEIFDEVNEENNEEKKKTVELTPQEEVDMEDRPVIKYNYSDPNHKPPFKNGEDYTEIDASNDEETNAIAFGKKGKYLIEITERYGMAYLYHNRDTNKIEIWGESRKFDNVIQDIGKRYKNAENYLIKKNQSEVTQ